MRIAAVFVSGLALFGSATFAFAQTPSAQDKEFIKEAASGGTLEVRLGLYASQHAASTDVKKFGEHMVGDHGKAHEALQTLTTQEPLEIPRVMNEEDKQTLEKLEKLNGVEFDKAYVAQMVEDHKNDIAAFEKEVSQGSDPAIKAFAEKLLPTLKHHLEMAESLNRATNGEKAPPPASK